MRIPSKYENYLQKEVRRYGWMQSEDNSWPGWLILELETYYWMLRLGRSMRNPWENGTVSKRILDRIEKIPTIRFLRYRDISPALKEAIQIIAAEFVSLREDLKRSEYWKKSYVLSKKGVQRWSETVKVVYDCTHAEPDPEWREQWEKERLHPYCTRREAETLASKYIYSTTGHNLNQMNSETGKCNYYHFSKVKGRTFRMRYGRWSETGKPFQDMGAVEVDMLTREVKCCIFT